MENIRKIFLEQIKPCTDTFNNLSSCLINPNLLGDVLLALQKIKPLYSRANIRQFLSHYIVYYFPNEVVGKTGDIAERLVNASQSLYDAHLKNETLEFVNALNEYMLSFTEWQRFDKQKLAGTYRDTYRLLSEIKVSSPIEIKEPIEKLESTLNKHTAQIFGKNAQKILGVNQSKEILREDMIRLEKFVYDSLHDIYWLDIAKQLEENCFDNLCTVIEDVKGCMLTLCQKNKTKCDEIEACLDVGFLKNVLNVGMAQNQVKCLLKYCLVFLREYGQPCHDSEIDELTKTTDLLYTPEVINTIQLLVNIIREIGSRMNILVAVVDEIGSNIG